jgi:DNA-binding LytR/AlgR family response regulator
MKTRVAIVDDDYSSLTAMKNYCDTLGVNSVAFQSPLEFIKFIDENRIDLAVLDYQLPQMNGLQLAELLNSKDVPVIFITGHRDEIASKSWDLNCLACLEKPVTIEKMRTALQKFKPQTSNRNISLPVHGGEIVQINISEIAFVTSCERDSSGNDRYLQTVTGKGYRIVNKNLEEILELLPENDFCRINRYHIVSRNTIETFSKTLEEVKLKVNHPHKNPCLFEEKSGQVTLNISDTFRKNFKDWIKKT